MVKLYVTLNTAFHLAGLNIFGLTAFEWPRHINRDERRSSVIDAEVIDIWDLERCTRRRSKLRTGNLYHHDPTMKPGLGSPPCLSLLNPSQIGSGFGGLLSAVHGFNTGIPYIQKNVKGPKFPHCSCSLLQALHLEVTRFQNLPKKL